MLRRGGAGWRDLARPLLALLVVAVLVSVPADLFGRAAPLVAGYGMVWVVRPGATVATVVAVGLAAVIIVRPWTGRIPELERPVAAVAVVFMVAGLVPVVASLPWSTPARAANRLETPAYLILLDGYPRADSLAGYWPIGYPQTRR